MGDEIEFQRKQLDQMSVEQIAARVRQNQREIDMFLEPLFTRARVQEYTEEKYTELLALLQETLPLLKEFLVGDTVTLEWINRSSEVVRKLQEI